jgi:hypothetical protein
MIAFPIILGKIKRRLPTINEPKAAEGFLLRIVLGFIPYFLVPIGLLLFLRFDGIVAAVGVFCFISGEVCLIIYALLMGTFLIRGFPTSSPTDDSIQIVDGTL